MICYFSLLLTVYWSLMIISYSKKICVGVLMLRPSQIKFTCLVRYRIHMAYTPNGYIVPMEFCVHLFSRRADFSRRTNMHLNVMFLIGAEFFKIIVPL